MAAGCEVCGSPISAPPRYAMIDGSALRVCNSCSRLGPAAPSPMTVSRRPIVGSNPRSTGAEVLEPELEVRSDFSKIIREGREKMGLSQEKLGFRIAEKASVIKMLEGGRLKPDNTLARKLERFFKIQLMVPVEA